MGEFNRFSRFANANSTKKKEIEEVLKLKEQSIKRHTDAKSLSIAVSSAFNGASQIATALLHNGELKFENYWEAHNAIYKDYLSLFLEAQAEEAEKFAGRVYRSAESKNLLIPDSSGEKAL